MLRVSLSFKEPSQLTIVRNKFSPRWGRLTLEPCFFHLLHFSLQSSTKFPHLSTSVWWFRPRNMSLLRTPTTRENITLGLGDSLDLLRTCHYHKRLLGVVLRGLPFLIILFVLFTIHFLASFGNDALNLFFWIWVIITELLWAKINIRKEVLGWIPTLDILSFVVKVGDTITNRIVDINIFVFDSLIKRKFISWLTLRTISDSWRSSIALQLCVLFLASLWSCVYLLILYGLGSTTLALPSELVVIKVAKLLITLLQD